MKKTVIIGASPNPSRYSYMAAEMLVRYNHEFVPVGVKKGELFGKQILSIHERPIITDVDTITLYIGPLHQTEWYDYLMDIKPKRIIFNPGAENDELSALSANNKIENLEACTLVMLATGQY